MADEHDSLNGTVQPLTTTTDGRLAERQAEVESVTAFLLAGLYDNAEHSTEAGLSRLTARNRALMMSTSNDEIMRAIASQMSALEGLFHRYILLAQAPALAPAVVEAYLRIALSAERVFLRASAVMATLKTLEKPV